MAWVPYKITFILGSLGGLLLQSKIAKEEYEKTLVSIKDNKN